MFVECGPKPVLINYLQDNFGEQKHQFGCWYTSDDKASDNVNPVSLALAKAVAHGSDVDESAIFGAKQVFDRKLPTYRWDDSELRADDTNAINNYYSTVEDYAPLLGRESHPGSNVWINEIDTNIFPKLADHVIGGNAIMPAAGYLDMALCAVQRATKLELVELNHVDIVSPMPLSASGIREVKTEVDPKSNSFYIESRISGSSDDFQLHMIGRVRDNAT